HYTLRIQGRNYNGLWSTIRNLNLIIHPPYWQTGWFRILLFLLLSTAVVMLYRSQLERRTLKARLEAEEARRQQQEAELKEKEAAYQLKLSRTEMAALRSQMNPHFIFNCLNSIQYFTALNDVEKASDYLNRFSRLIRLVLENSKTDKVTLSRELEILQLYIEMEAMRFPHKLHYRIDLDNAIDAEWVQIPPLLLQPFVENAIWHGLMHKDEGGTVQVRIGQSHKRLLHVEITDDGVGRAQAAAYKSKSATKTKSLGMKITAERIEIINQIYQTQTQIKIIDLVDEHGQAIGTTILVNIPI
ncbi:histidine kinase, partial [Nostoc sp. CHAB 5834]|nr:histidine kinase [Nostoc sp. CHAB 5834]